ncbi:MAG: T9SS type A sorting domain-containing protein, partial [Bacteroidota bacterium]
NPAKVYTTIPVNIPQNIQAAYLDVTDTQGKLVKRVVIEERGASSIQLRFDLAAGLYFYTLVTDGEIIDTKRMMLTK